MDVKLFDPYRLVDPTQPAPAPVLSRSIGGKFNGYSMLAAMGDDHFPIDSLQWQRYARGAFLKLDRLLGGIHYKYWEVADQIIPPAIEDQFSYRTQCEMVEAACDAIEKGEDPVRAAHQRLEVMQNECARTYLDRLLGDEAPAELDAERVAETIQNFLGEKYTELMEVHYE